MTERIDDYFGQRLSPAEKAQFEADLLSDPQLAGDVAFYLASKKAAIMETPDQALSERHAEWQSMSGATPVIRLAKVWYAAAAVILVLIGVSWLWFVRQDNSLKEMAIQYEKEHFTSLPLQMGDSSDSLQLAMTFYNKADYANALNTCARILESDPDHAEAKKVAGIVSLKLRDYDKAIDYFHSLGEQQGLYSNHGKFYEAIALLKRDNPGDIEKSKVLLQEVADKNLEGKREAEEWLKMN